MDTYNLLVPQCNYSPPEKRSALLRDAAIFESHPILRTKLKRLAPALRYCGIHYKHELDGY
jgi:hypothetical protein